MGQNRKLKQEEILAQTDPFHGYGSDQTFKNLLSETSKNSEKQIRSLPLSSPRVQQLVDGQNDELTISCTFDSSKKRMDRIWCWIWRRNVWYNLNLLSSNGR